MNGAAPLLVCTNLGTLMFMFIHLYCMTGLLCHSSCMSEINLNEHDQPERELITFI